MKQDEAGHTGTFLRKDVAPIADRGIGLAMRKLGPLVLPYSEQVNLSGFKLTKRINHCTN